MLGVSVDVLIDGSAYGQGAKFCAPFFRGYIINSNSSLYNKSVYVISNNPEERYVHGTVIAIANKGIEKKEKLIVAPTGCIYYSPEIRNRLSRVRNQHSFRLSCLYEKSCGAIIFKIKNNQRYFLLVKNKNGKNWGFPKGHIEVGETEEQTAIREIKEETNLDVTILNGFRKKSFYRPFGKTRKKVVIFLAQSSQDHVKKQNSEIEGYKWLKEDEVLKYLRYPNDLCMFESAIKFLYKKNIH
ncbi:MAG: NUDIX domain-containing protein [Eubacteriales bacterium SKADARSKE-1]|nr:NUDIX domain-containing protein [Eubacteriales bacterium SKADARSKE-1]